MRRRWTAFLILFPALLLAVHSALAQSVSVTALVPGVCGNGIKEAGEQCDKTDLGGQTCVSQGFGGGTLSCTAGCTFNTSLCTPLPPSTPSVSGGGGGGTAFSVVSGPVLPPNNPVVSPGRTVMQTVDLDQDTRINIRDLSIELFYYGRSGPDVARYDFDHDGKVDIVDISILLYYWNAV